jgi:hypothetical protein
LCWVFTQCNTLFDKTVQDPRGPMYAGAQTCIKCHKNVYDTYLHTAHAQSTHVATAQNVQGNFAADHNSFVFKNGQKVVMEKRADGLYQVGYTDGKKTQEQRFDITFGGVKAETYLYWKDNAIYQLPMSYFSKLHSWTNSPGYDTTHIDFSRAIGKRCFECHASYITELPPQTQSLQQKEVQFDKASLINGIDCERCHGPAANHVNFHTDFPEEKKAKYIARYSELTRGQKIDMCAVCHSGNKDMVITSTFNFKPGDTLANFIEPSFMHDNEDASQFDVHGKQSQMLASSQCFIKSKMDCGTCHNTHINERESLPLYSQRCMSCHKTSDHSFCKMAPKLGAAIQQSCIDCHMPLKASGIITVQTAQQSNAAPYMVRTHHIAIYNNEKEKISNYLNKSLK